MKIFHFIYGFISAITLIALLFNNYADVVLDDYYVEKLYHDWYNYWNGFNLTTNCLFAICSIIWVYTQGLNAAKEPLLINKEEENE